MFNRKLKNGDFMKNYVEARVQQKTETRVQQKTGDCSKIRPVFFTGLSDNGRELHQ